jgi:hypothetical protein
MTSAGLLAHKTHSFQTVFSKKPYLTRVRKIANFSNVTIDCKTVREQKCYLVAIIGREDLTGAVGCFDLFISCKVTILAVRTNLKQLMVRTINNDAVQP